MDNYRLTHYLLLIISTCVFVIKSQTLSQLWSDPMDSFPSDWSSTSNAKLVTTTNCISSSKCWLLQASGEMTQTLDTTNYENLKFSFTVNTNLGNNEYCKLYVRRSSSSSWTQLDQYNAATSSTSQTVSLPSTTSNTNIEIRFQNTGNQIFANKDTDSCWLDTLSVAGTLIIVPTATSTTNSPTSSTTALASIPSVTTARTPTFFLTAPTTAAPTACKWLGTRRGHECDEDYALKSEVDIFSNWASFGIWVAVITLFGLMGYGGCLQASYFVMKDIIVAMFGVETTGIVEFKYQKKHRRKSGKRYYTAVTCWIRYRYIGPGKKEYCDDRMVLNAADWMPLQIGHHVAVKYLPMIPRCNKKEHGGYGAYGYCSPLCICCVFCCISVCITGVGVFIASLSMSNVVELTVLTIIGTMVFCSFPCVVYHSIKDCANIAGKKAHPLPQNVVSVDSGQTMTRL